MHRDYAAKGVKFFFIYKSLAHPELAGDYVQPFTLDERLTHARLAEKRLGATIPWLVDAMDNRLKRALGDRPNSEYVIDPQGKIVRKRPWSHPAQVRHDLEELVGPVERVTSEAEIQLKMELPAKAPAARNVLPRINREDFLAIRSQPKIEEQGLPFFAKLRAEGNDGLVATGEGKLYLGMHLDPIHRAHWNNLTKPLRIVIEAPEGVELETREWEAPQVEVASDADPRECVIGVKAWPVDQPIKVVVHYFACVEDETCHAVRQEYRIVRKRDEDGGRARSDAAGNWDPEKFAKQMLQRDKDRDGELSREEVQGLVRPHFDHFDTDRSGRLSLEELKAVSDWLNHHHLPGAKPLDKPASPSERP